MVSTSKVFIQFRSYDYAKIVEYNTRVCDLISGGVPQNQNNKKSHMRRRDCNLSLSLCMVFSLLLYILA